VEYKIRGSVRTKAEKCIPLKLKLGCGEEIKLPTRISPYHN